MAVLASAVEGSFDVKAKEFSAIEPKPKRDRWSCVFTCASERLGWAFCAAVLRLAAPCSPAD